MEGSRPRARGRQLIRWGISLAVVVVVFFVALPQIADMSEVWRTFSAMTWLEVGTLVLAAAWNLITYWILLMVTLPGLSLAKAMIVTEASTAAASVLPAGPAVGAAVAYRMYASWGFRRPTIALALVVSGVGDLFAKLAMPALALLFLSYYGDAGAGLRTASLIAAVILLGGVAVFVAALKSDASAQRMGDALAAALSTLRRVIGRQPVAGWGEGMGRFRTETLALLRNRWPLVVTASLLSHVSLYFVLLLTLRHIGVSDAEVGWAEVLGAFAFVRLLSAIPITPGGIGIVELGLSASLVLAGGPEAPVVAGVLLFRALTFLIQIPFGALTYLYWQHSDGHHPTSDADLEQVPG
jgi:uncharacterized membrane protein YbhN (UPF0104 family)